MIRPSPADRRPASNCNSAHVRPKQGTCSQSPRFNMRAHALSPNFKSWLFAHTFSSRTKQQHGHIDPLLRNKNWSAQTKPPKIVYLPRPVLCISLTAFPQFCSSYLHSSMTNFRKDTPLAFFSHKFVVFSRAFISSEKFVS